VVTAPPPEATAIAGTMIAMIGSRPNARRQIFGTAVVKYDCVTIPSTMKKFHVPTVTGSG